MSLTAEVSSCTHQQLIGETREDGPVSTMSACQHTYAHVCVTFSRNLKLLQSPFSNLTPNSNPRLSPASGSLNAASSLPNCQNVRLSDFEVHSQTIKGNQGWANRELAELNVDKTVSLY